MTIILTGRTLLDGSGGEPISDPVVLVHDDRIAGVYQGRIPDEIDVSDAQRVDLPESTLMPGLIDTHVHLNLPGDGTPFAESVAESDGFLLATSAHNARTALEAGITTLRDTGGRGMTTFDLRDALRKGYGAGSRLVLCGSPITITGGHTWYFGAEADGVDEVRKMAREMAKRGADFIKVMGTGGGTRNTLSHLPSYSAAEVAAVVDEAHNLGRRVTIHCLAAEATRFAIRAGADGIEHAGFLVDHAGTQRYEPDLADEIARSGALATSTLSVGSCILQEMHGRQTLTAQEQSYLSGWEVMMEDNLRQFRALHEAGVKWVAGTDAGWRLTPFDALAGELVLMHRAGMSAAETIVAATSRAAEALGREGEIGSVREGYLADLIAVPGNPLDDLDVLSRPELVIQSGKIIRAPVSA